MFANEKRQLRTDAEHIAERALVLSDDEISRLEERREILRDVVNSLDARLQEIPERDRKALQCLLYSEIAGKVFDFRLSLETRLAREKIREASSTEEKITVLATFHTIMKDVEMLHGE